MRSVHAWSDPGPQQEGHLQSVSVRDGWEHLQDARPLTNAPEMNRQEPIKTECETFEFEGLAALWGVWHPPLFLIMVTWVLPAMFLDCGTKPQKTTTEAHVNVGKGLAWNQTHNLPAQRPPNSKQRKELSDWLVFNFICLLFFFLSFFFPCCVYWSHTHMLKQRNFRMFCATVFPSTTLHQLFKESLYFY